jgi:hypothetical protein
MTFPSGIFIGPSIVAVQSATEQALTIFSFYSQQIIVDLVGQGFGIWRGLVWLLCP